MSTSAGWPIASSRDEQAGFILANARPSAGVDPHARFRNVSRARALRPRADPIERLEGPGASCAPRLVPIRTPASSRSRPSRRSAGAARRASRTIGASLVFQPSPPLSKRSCAGRVTFSVPASRRAVVARAGGQKLTGTTEQLAHGRQAVDARDVLETAGSARVTSVSSCVARS
jgi:hypothetical protein